MIYGIFIDSKQIIKSISILVHTKYKKYIVIFVCTSLIVLINFFPLQVFATALQDERSKKEITITQPFCPEKNKENEQTNHNQNQQLDIPKKLSSFLESDPEDIKDLNKRLNYPKFQPSYVSDRKVKIIQTILECSGNQGFLILSAFR